MKRFLVILCLCFVSVSAFAQFKGEVRKYIALDPAPLRKKASAVSEQVGKLPYATAVIILEEKKDWVLVCPADNEKLKGWVPVTALSKKKLVAKENTGSANAKEIALAGKGFSSTIEESYSANGKADFSDVNTVETYEVSDSEISSFVTTGKLNEGEK